MKKILKYSICPISEAKVKLTKKIEHQEVKMLETDAHVLWRSPWEAEILLLQEFNSFVVSFWLFSTEGESLLLPSSSWLIICGTFLLLTSIIFWQIPLHIPLCIRNCSRAKSWSCSLCWSLNFPPQFRGFRVLKGTL